MSTQLTLANASNGLIYPHDQVCMFQSNHAHRPPYFRLDAMPHSASIHLMKGGSLLITDVRSKPGLTDALRWGVTTWCLVYNDAAGFPYEPVCPWETPAMRKAATYNHTTTRHALRRLMRYYPPSRPAIVGDNVHLLTHHVTGIDDQPNTIREILT